MGDTAKEKLEVAHEKLKKNIAMNEDEERTEGAEITFKCLINVK